MAKDLKKICVIGGGRWGKNHINTLEKMGCLAGIVESDPLKLAAYQDKEKKGVKVFANVREAVNESFDGYTIATPAATHFELAQYVLNHKKPVLVEKPLALSSEEAIKLDRLAVENNVALMVGHVLLFHPAIRCIKGLIDQGKIGKLQYIYSNRLNLGTVRTEENILWSFAPHDISIFQYFIGELPIEVISRGGAFIQPQIHDSTMTVLRYANNVVGHIFVSWLHPFKEHRLVVIGSKGMLSFDDSSDDRNITFYEKGIDWVQGEPIKRDGPAEVIPYERHEALREELNYFMGCIDKKVADIANGKNAVQVLQILEQASASILNDQLTDVSPVKENKSYFVHESAYVDNNVHIGEGTKIWHFSHIQPGAQIGKKCSIGQNVNVANNVKIGNGVKIQNNVAVYEGVELEDFVFCGPSMVFTNINDPRSKYPQRGSDFYLKTLVKEGASIGANATIVCGHTIGRHAFIGAGAVVTRDVPDYAMMVGVPARRVGWVCECGEKLVGKTEIFSCKRCSMTYQLKSDTLFPLPTASMNKMNKNE